MNLTEMIREIESHYRGPVAAARAHGVDYRVWWRWRDTGRATESAKALIRKIYQETTGQEVDGGKETGDQVSAV